MGSERVIPAEGDGAIVDAIAMIYVDEQGREVRIDFDTDEEFESKVPENVQLKGILKAIRWILGTGEMESVLRRAVTTRRRYVQSGAAAKYGDA